MADLPLFQQFILNEIEGKNKAFDSYNAIIWKIRTGYLTLIFVGWGFILQGILNDKDINHAWLYFVITSMLFISGGLSIGGLVLDIAYVLRKFRVIEGLNGLFTFLIDNPAINTPNDGQKEKIKGFIKVSGITGELGAVRRKFAISVIFSAAPVYLIPMGFLIYLYYYFRAFLAYFTGLPV